MITFNNIVERFKVFAENHFFIETFSFGSPDDVDLSKFTSFPLMHLVYTGATYDAGTKTYNLEVYILDVPGDKTKKVDRQKEVVSDAEQCAEDILADIKNGGNIFLFAQDYEVVNATTTLLEEETKNVLSGVLLDLSVAIPYEWDACNAPIDGVEPGGTEVTYARRGVLRMLTLDGATDVPSVRTIKVTNGTLTDDGDGVVTLDTGGVDTLAGLTDVDVTGVTDGQVLKYDDATGEWIPANDQSATSLGNLDDVSIVTPADREALIYDGGNWVNDNISKTDVGLGNVDNTSDADKPVSTATQTALDLKADTTAVPTDLNDLSDVSITGTPTGNQALIYDGTANVFKSLPNFTNRFEDEAEINKQSILPFPERVYTVKADGDGIFIDAQSDTPTAGKVIKRKIYQKTGFLESGAVIGDFTLIHTFADDTAYSATESTFEGFRDGDTYGTPPFTLIQTWEEVTAAPSFTGLLNETYGSGAEAAYSTRRLNGNVTECMVIRRASDSTTTTIGFVDGDIDESAITTFCTGTTCTVVTWKDQSGNAVDASAVNEGTVYESGALKKINGKLYIDGGRYDASFTGSSTGHLFMTLQRPTIGGTQRYIATSDSTNKYYFFGYDGNTGSTSSGVSVNSYRFNGTTASSVNRDFIWDNTANQTQATVDVDDSSLINRRLYYSGFNAPYYQEFIYYSSTKSTANRDSIESNIGDYFTQNTPLLDTYTGAAAAYSLRLLDSTYTGALINVWNGTSYADIYPNVFGELDTVALAAHCGSNDGFIRYWYDQSGNANHATQTTTAKMPKIYDGTTGVVTENGKPAVEFDGLDICDLSNFITPSTVSNYSVAGVSRPNSNDKTMLILSDGSENMTWHYGRTAGELSVGTYDGVTAVSASGPSTISTQFLGFSIHNFDTPQATLFIDGSPTSGTELSRGDFNSRIGGGPGGRNWQGTMQEIVVWDSDQSSNRTNIEENINTFYSIY